MTLPAASEAQFGETITLDDLTPRQIVTELDRYIIGQAGAKRAVAVALRNRTRRARLSEEMQGEIIPKNILMIGPTGVGKTEIARRLARLARAPFLKVEATKFTEVGYVGRDVDSLVRDLVQVSVRLVEAEMTESLRPQAEQAAVDRIVDILQPRRVKNNPASGTATKTPQEQMAEAQQNMARMFGFPVPPTPAQNAPAPPTRTEADDEYERRRNEQEERIRQRLREQVISGARDAEEIEIETEEQAGPVMIPLMGGPGGMGPGTDGPMDLQNLLSQMGPKRKKARRVPIAEARRIFTDEAAKNLLDQETVTREAVARTEQSGIVFLDEIDKVAGRSGPGGGSGPDVSREGVQRDLLPIIEGSTVQTKFGPVRTDYILFIAAGAFHVSKPSDLIPELQGRLPIRVELDSLTAEDFERILTEPRGALTRQYKELLAADGVTVTFTPDGVHEIARVAVEVNERTENIGARRLHTVMERVVEELSFEAPDAVQGTVTIDAAYVRARVASIAEDDELARYIL